VTLPRTPYPCDVCKRLHIGRRCTPADDLSERVALVLPRGLAERLRASVPSGQRSAFIARLVDRELP
jgi:hypothetical protein